VADRPAERSTEFQFFATVVQRWDARYARLVRAIDPAYLELLAYRWFCLRLQEHLREWDAPPTWDRIDVLLHRDGEFSQDEEKRREAREILWRLYEEPATWGAAAVKDFRDYLAWRHYSAGFSAVQQGFQKTRSIALTIDQGQREIDKARALMLEPEVYDVASEFPAREAAWRRERDNPGLRNQLETGIAALDRQIKLQDGTVTALLAVFKRYKSITLDHFSICGLVSGFNVAHVVFENEVDMTLDRIYSRLGVIPIDDLVKVRADPARQEQAYKFIKGLDTFLPNRLKLLKGIPKVTTVADIEAQLAVLETEQGFIPDVTVWDYANIIGVPKERRDREERINQETIIWDLQAHARDLRHGGARRKIVVTAIQAKAEALKAEHLDASHFGKAIGIPQALDCMIGINQTDQEKVNNEIRFSVLASRNSAISDEVKCKCNISWMAIDVETWGWVNERATNLFMRNAGVAP
jgi:hypothetical protein